VTVVLTDSMWVETIFTATPDSLGEYSFDVSNVLVWWYNLSYEVNHPMYEIANGMYDVFIMHDCDPKKTWWSKWKPSLPSPILNPISEEIEVELTPEEEIVEQEIVEKKREVIEESHEVGKIKEQILIFNALELPNRLPDTWSALMCYFE